MGPEIVAIIAVAAVIGATSITATVMAGISHIKSKIMRDHHEHEVSTVEETITKPDGTVITKVTHKGLVVSDREQEIYESYKRTGSEAIEKGVAKAIGELPSVAAAIATAGASQAAESGVVSEVIGTVAGALQDKGKDVDDVAIPTTLAALHEQIANLSAQVAELKDAVSDGDSVREEELAHLLKGMSAATDSAVMGDVQVVDSAAPAA